MENRSYSNSISTAKEVFAMKLAAKLLLSLSFFATLTATLAFAQNPIPFQHIVIVFQENRTPDNLFGAAAGPQATCGSERQFEPGVDIDNGGPNKVLGPTCDVPTHLYNSCDPEHDHIDYTNMYDGGLMDGACLNNYQQCTGTCPQYAYVPASDVNPYFQIAEDYGFANYMFQTNEGPSLPAHQFILSGTSAPVPYNSGEYTWFDADNPEGFKGAGDDTGCAPTNQTYQWARLIDNTDYEPTEQYCANNHNDPHCAPPCYDHTTLTDLLDVVWPPPNQVGWKYYTPQTGSAGLWVAPYAIQHLCQKGSDGKCDGLLPPNGLHRNNMRYETMSESYPLVDDIDSCSLAPVTWAIPDKRWSDHGGENPLGLGPYYVANIVNEIGESNCTDMVNGNSYTYWQDTAIFIVWDDWGGWFDHVPPFKLGGQSNGWGEYYTYGFRVPMLVVSAYTKAGYVSGAISGRPSYPPPLNVTHDFGSILAFIENNFLGYSAIGTIGPPQYEFADAYAPELGAGQGVIPLADFFQFPYRDFTPIILPPGGYDKTYFQQYFINNPSETPDGPDADY
jgi:phospholipase C